MGCHTEAEVADQTCYLGHSQHTDIKPASRSTDPIMPKYLAGRPLLFVGCLTSQQHANVSQGKICSQSFTCCLTETEVADHTFYLTKSQSTDNGLTNPSTDPMMPGAWQGSHKSAKFYVTGIIRPRKIPPSGNRTLDLPLSR